MLDVSRFITDLHRHHVAAELGGLEATQEALRPAIICAAIDLDLPTGLDVEELGKGLVFNDPSPHSPTDPPAAAKDTLSEFLDALQADQPRQ